MLTCFIDKRICHHGDCGSCMLMVEHKESFKKKGLIEEMINKGISVKLIAMGLDSRCNSIVIAPLDYLCTKYNIPMSINPSTSSHIQLYYRCIPPGPKINPNQIMGVLLDDLPSAYISNATMYNSFISSLKHYDFFVVFNTRLGSFLRTIVGETKPILYYPGISCKEFYESQGVVFNKVDNGSKKKMALVNSVYEFNTKSYYHPGWEMLYFSKVDKQIPYSTKVNPTDLVSYYRILSEFSPDIIVQDWIDSPSFYYKSNLKMRETIAVNSCLLANDKGNLYDIKNGVNGYNWKTIQEFHNILDSLPVEKFRDIGKSHINKDLEIIRKLHQDISNVYANIMRNR